MNDHSLIFRFLTKDEGYDGHQFIAEGQDAVDWGRELFEFFKKDSTVIIMV